MMMPKQNPVKPAPPIAPSCAPVNPKSAAQLARMPPRIPNPIPAARMARKPAHSNRVAFGAMASPRTVTLLIALPLCGEVLGGRPERRELYDLLRLGVRRPGGGCQAVRPGPSRVLRLELGLDGGGGVVDRAALRLERGRAFLDTLHDLAVHGNDAARSDCAVGRHD